MGGVAGGNLSSCRRGQADGASDGSKSNQHINRPDRHFLTVAPRLTTPQEQQPEVETSEGERWRFRDTGGTRGRLRPLFLRTLLAPQPEQFDQMFGRFAHFVQAGKFRHAVDVVLAAGEIRGGESFLG